MLVGRAMQPRLRQVGAMGGSVHLQVGPGLHLSKLQAAYPSCGGLGPQHGDKLRASGHLRCVLLLHCGQAHALILTNGLVQSWGVCCAGVHTRLQLASLDVALPRG